MQELRQLTPKKLSSELEKARTDLTAVKFQVRTGKNQNTGEIRKKKMLVARILTLLQGALPVLSPSKK